VSYIIPFVLYTVMSVTKMSSSSSPRKMKDDNDDDIITSNQRPSKIFILVEGNRKEAEI
jgi:hypothetical protein